MKITHIIALALAVGAAGTAHAASVNVNTSSAGPVNTSGLSGFSTTGADMVGMLVTATFSTGVTETAAWAATGSSSGAAGTDDWTVSLGDNSFNTPFSVFHSLTTASLVSLSFAGAPGDTVFDVLDVSGDERSPDSARGREYRDESSPNGTIEVTYSRPLSVDGDFFGDLYVNMDVDYSGLVGGGLAAGETLTFIADTDNVAIAGDIAPIPVPAAGLLLLPALGALGALGRRRHTA